MGRFALLWWGRVWDWMEAEGGTLMGVWGGEAEGGKGRGKGFVGGWGGGEGRDGVGMLGGGFSGGGKRESPRPTPVPLETKPPTCLKITSLHAPQKN
jgi:hypothetical protein